MSKKREKIVCNSLDVVAYIAFFLTLSVDNVMHSAMFALCSAFAFAINNINYRVMGYLRIGGEEK